MNASKDILNKGVALSLYILVFAFPFSKSAIEISSVSAFILWILYRIASYKPGTSLVNLFKPIPTKLNLPIYLFALAGLISTFDTFSIILSLKGYFFKLLQGLILFFISAEVIDNRKRLNLILTLIFASTALTVLDGIYQYITTWDFIRHHHIAGWDIVGENAFYLRRMSASFSNSNGLGGWLAVIIPLALSTIFIDENKMLKRITKYMIGFLAGISMLCLLLTRSKGALLGFIFGFIFFIAFKKKKILLVFIITVFLALLFFNGFAINRYTNTDNLISGANPISCKGSLYHCKDYLLSIKKYLVSTMLEKDSIRANLWRQAIQIIKDFPIFGCGLNTYSIVAPHYKNAEREAGIYPHNSYLQMAAEMGIVGLMAFLFILVTSFKASFYSIKRTNGSFYNNILIGLNAGFFGFLVHSFFDVNFYALQLANLMWFIMGLIVAVQKIAVKEENADARVP